MLLYDGVVEGFFGSHEYEGWSAVGEGRDTIQDNDLDGFEGREVAIGNARSDGDIV